METPRTSSSTSLALSCTYASGRRTCPYGRTPRQRRIADPKTAFSTPATPTATVRGRRTPVLPSVETPGPLPGLTNKTWQVFHLSPLYRFSTHPRSLKQYGRSLAVYFVQEVDKEIAVDQGRGRQCALSIYEGLQAGEDDPEAVQILVTSKANNGASGNGGVHVALTAVLCGVDLELNPCVEMKGHFTYYPVLLVKATVAHTNILRSWLERHFDCRVSPLIPSSKDLAWMVAMWSGTIAEKKNKPVELLYTVPEGCEGLSRITYTIDPADCKRLWDSIRSADSEEFTGEEVAAFIKSLEEHFYECFRVKLWKLELTRVGTSIAYVGDGKLKIFSADAAWKVLRLMSELALEQFQLLATVC